MNLSTDSDFNYFKLKQLFWNKAGIQKFPPDISQRNVIGLLKSVFLNFLQLSLFIINKYAGI